MVSHKGPAQPVTPSGYQASVLHALNGSLPKGDIASEENGSQSPTRSRELFTPLSGLAGELCRPRTVGDAAGPVESGDEAEGGRDVRPGHQKRRGSYNPVVKGGSKRARELPEGERKDR
jgi:hypothetical protein